MDLTNRLARLNMVNCRKYSPNKYRICAMGPTTGESWYSSRQGQSFSSQIPHQPCGSPASYPMGAGGCFRGGQVTNVWRSEITTTSTKIKKVSNPP
jgi:hypothetical protein